MIGPLAGFTVGITAHRRWEEQAETLTRRGARILHGPTMRTELLDDSQRTIAVTEQFLEGSADIVVLTTGIGTRSWFGAAESHGIDQRLRDAVNASMVVARGPKAAAAARAAGVEVGWIAQSETNAEVKHWLLTQGVGGKRVVVQRDGGEPLLANELTQHGALVVDVPVYRWHLPQDTGPARRMLEAARVGQVDAITFTCAYAVHNAFELSDDPAGLANALTTDVVSVAVGPITAQALRDHGVERIVEPPRARMGSMLHALTEAMADRHRVLRLDAHEATWQGSIMIDRAGAVTELAPSDCRLLTMLLSRSPAVVPKADLVGGADEHAAEVAVARLRSRLGPLGAGIQTVRRRGYSCTIEMSSPVFSP